MRYNKITYSDSPLDRVIRVFGLNVNRPITVLLSGGACANYNRTKQLDTNGFEGQHSNLTELRPPGQGLFLQFRCIFLSMEVRYKSIGFAYVYVWTIVG